MALWLLFSLGRCYLSFRSFRYETETASKENLRNSMTKKQPSRSKSKSTPNGKPAKQNGSDELTQENVERVLEMERAAKRNRSRSDLVAEAIAQFCGSMTFVWVHVIWFGAWITINTLPGINHIDPFPFTFLTLVVSLEAIFLSTFILISQNHDTKLSERRNHLDLQINLLSEQENTKMLSMLEAIASKVGAKVVNDPKLDLLRQETSPEKVVEQIERRQEK